jgi:hypothetical protein
MYPAGDGRAEAAIERALARADREWRAMRVIAADRAALREDLRRELVGAAADGVLPDQLIGPDIRRFARELAISAGVRRVPYEFRRLLLTGLVGGIPGVVLAWFLVWPSWWLPQPLPLLLLPPRDVDFALHRFSACVLVFMVGVLAATDRGMRGDPARERTVAAMAVLLPVAGVLVVPVTMWFARLVDYSTAPPALLAEAAIVGAALAGGAVLARRWALAPMLGPRHPPVSPDKAYPTTT